MDIRKTQARTVLIVDDDADMRLYLRGCLRSLGLADVLEANSESEAMQLVQTLHIDLVISDILMEDGDGYALCEALKTSGESEAVAVVLISGEVDWERLGAVCADAFLAKPFNAASLEDTLERVLSKSS